MSDEQVEAAEAKTEEAEAAEKTEATEGGEKKAVQQPEAKTEDAGNVEKQGEQVEKPKTLAEGGEAKSDDPEHKPFWPEDWRQKMAEHAANGDQKAYERELKRLERFADPTGVYGMSRELEAKFSKGGLVKVPGEDATEEEVKAFHKAIGVPEDPKEYVENLTLPEGVTLGDQDKQLASDFAQYLHKAGAPQSVMDAAYSWYLKSEEDRAASVDQQDEKNRLEATKELKEEWGPSYQRNINALSALAPYMPGGWDLESENSLANKLLAGRLADGTVIGDDPSTIRFLHAIAKEINPVATVVESADGSGKGIDDEIAEIESLMRTDRRAYDKDTKKQERYLELLAARDKHRARNAA